MTVHSFHLAAVPRMAGATALVRSPAPATVPGLDHLECLSLMRLGAPVVSPDRLQLRRLAVFAQWADEAALVATYRFRPISEHGAWEGRTGIVPT